MPPVTARGHLARASLAAWRGFGFEVTKSDLLTGLLRAGCHGATDGSTLQEGYMRDVLRWFGLTGILLAACTEGPVSPDPAGSQDATPDAALSSAATRSEFPLFEQFDDINPCSGLTATTTISGTAGVIDQGGREILKIQEEISTSDGFTGRGRVQDVINYRNEILRIEDMLSSASGARYRVQRLLVVDLVNGVVRVTTGGPVLTCVR